MKAPLNLSHLKFFCDAVVYNSISEAAKMNYVSQSAVSQAIARLEIILEAQLLIHTRQKFQLTEVGKVVFEQASQIFKNVEGIYEKISQKGEGVSGVIKFVSTKSLGMSFLPSLYKQTQLNLPGVNLSFLLGGRNFIRNALRQHEAEFAIVVYDEDFAQFAKRPLRTGQLKLYQNIEAPTHQIENGIFVDYFEDPYVKDLKDHLIRTNRSQIKIKAELSSWETVARFTEMNIGVGFFPDYIMANNRYPMIKPYPIDIPHFEYQICAIYNKEQPLSRLAGAFLDQFANGSGIK
ncbi:MAG: LysR family transcriptional regulator [Verrucomicrobiota bacterium]|nr:LysR family transcriptional regulator [Verrucomicrobiota bacterium]